MKNTKRRIEPLSFFDHTGISGHLEKMAAKGWMIEKIVNTGWVYRRIEPKKIHFAVSYFPKASEFDLNLLRNRKCSMISAHIPDGSSPAPLHSCRFFTMSVRILSRLKQTLN